MAVSITDISVASVSGVTVTSLTTPAMTIAAGPNLAGVLGIGWGGNNPTSITGSIGGVSSAAIAGTDTGTSLGYRSLMRSVIAPPSGSQTATMSWTNAVNACMGAIVTSGVDQTTPVNNGTFSFSASSGAPSLAITSTGGDLTVDVQVNSAGNNADTTDQTLQWTKTNFVANQSGGGGTGPGTGSTTHTWTIAAAGWLQSGCNFKAAADTIGPANLTSSAGRYIGWIR